MSGSEEAAQAPRGRVRIWQWLGPGLITGASDDDPSGIATYAQVGAQFGYGLSWVMLFSFPLMASIQEICARIGRVTGEGIAGNLRRYYPAWLLQLTVGLLLIANVINLGADLGAMGDALYLVLGGAPKLLYVVLLGALCVGLEIFMQYRSYVNVLKWTTVALFSYVMTALVVDVPWAQVLHDTFVPSISLDTRSIVSIVAVMGTTISPYLFFWQSSEEAEDERIDPLAHPLVDAPDEAPSEIRRIRIDTYLGMALSNLISLFIIVTTGTVSWTSRLPPRRRRPCARSPASSRSWCSRSASSARVSSRFPCSQARRPMRLARRCSGRSAWRGSRWRPEPSMRPSRLRH